MASQAQRQRAERRLGITEERSRQIRRWAEENYTVEMALGTPFTGAKCATIATAVIKEFETEFSDKYTYSRHEDMKTLIQVQVHNYRDRLRPRAPRPPPQARREQPQPECAETAIPAEPDSSSCQGAASDSSSESEEDDTSDDQSEIDSDDEEEAWEEYESDTDEHGHMLPEDDPLADFFELQKRQGYASTLDIYLCSKGVTEGIKRREWLCWAE